MKRTLTLTGLLLGSVAVAAPGNWKGTITMYAQEYTPNKPNAPRKLQEMRRVADEYERRYPGIKIRFITDELPDANAAYRAKAAAGELYDVFWAQWTNLNGSLPRGIAVDLAPYFRQKNPYAPTFKTWGDAMNPTVIRETAAPGGQSYNINGDFVATAFYYNRDLFRKAGITREPATWDELVATAKRLRAAGIPAQVGVPLYSWWQRHFLSDFYARDYARIAGYDKASGISPLDEAVAIKKGLLSTRDPRFLAWWPIFKEFTDTWVPDYLAQDPDKNSTIFRQDFLGGRAAMMYEGSWTPNKIRDAGVQFNYGSFNFPTLGKGVSQYSSGGNFANAVGGPNAGFQYAVSTPQANKTMREPGKLAAVIDWLRYIGTPQVNQRVVNELGDFLPTFSSTKARTGNEALTAQSRLRLRAVQVGGSSATLDADMQRLFSAYLSGDLSLDAARTQVQQALDRAADDYGRRNNVDFSKY